MADLVRSAKSGSAWKTNELLAFNIEIQTVGATAFFNTTDSELPAAPVSNAILNNLEEADGPLTDNDWRFFRYMEGAEQATGEDGAVDDFLLRTLGYNGGGRVIHVKRDLSFKVAGQLVDAKPDVCLVKDCDYLLIVQEERTESPENPEPQLIAGLIAAFYQSRLQREQAGLPLPQSQVIAGIATVGTAPIFYRTTVSGSLLDAVATGSYPKEKTVVFKLFPPVSDVMRYTTGGMRPLENRRAAFQCLEALKGVIN